MDNPGIQKRLALDTNIILDLARGIHAAEEAFGNAHDAGMEVYAPQTVLAELYRAASNPSSEACQDAQVALESLHRVWGIEPRQLKPVGVAIAEGFSDHIREKGLLAHNERNDGLIIAESSLIGCPFLITSDQHILSIEISELHLALADRDLAPVLPVHPHKFVRAVAAVDP